jgi:hypothetical protein
MSSSSAFSALPTTTRSLARFSPITDSKRTWHGYNYGLLSEKIFANEQKFQDIIPELIPGVCGGVDEPLWVAEARSILWTVEHQQEHKKLCQRSELLQKPSPAPILSDCFGLQQYWPLCVSFLCPISPDMAQAVNTMSQLLLRREVVVEKTTSKTDNTNYFSTLSRQVVQDKILSPIMKALASNADSSKTQLSILDARLKECTNDTVLDNTSATYSAQIDQQKTELVRQRDEDLHMQSALKDLWDVIVREKECLEMKASRKRRLALSFSGTDHTEAKKH